jgi:hypothetical protein
MSLDIATSAGAIQESSGAKPRVDPGDLVSQAETRAIGKVMVSR